MPHPKDVPLDQWPDGWLKLACTSILEDVTYIMLYDEEKQRLGYPVTRQEMIDLIRSKHP